MSGDRQYASGESDIKGAYSHEWDDTNGATCNGQVSVDVPLRAGPCPYAARCDSREHLHPVLVCTAPSGEKRRFEFYKHAGWRLDPYHQDDGSPGYGHKHPWSAAKGKGEIFYGLSALWPEGEFRAERIPVLQDKHGKPKDPEPPPPSEPPPWVQAPPQPPGFKQVSAGLTPEKAVREPLRTWTEPKADKPATAPVDDGWAEDGSDIPF